MDYGKAIDIEQTVNKSDSIEYDISDLENHVVIPCEPARKIFTHVDVLPSFPGGEAAMRLWIKENLKYPTVTAEEASHGCVVVRFVVSSDGSIGGIEVLHSLGRPYDFAAIRLVTKMPNWNPGKVKGEAVNTYYTLSVPFELQK
jgi:protein TonB